ncbi:serine hydrolase domain-containing protein [Paenibacillus harenae]|uniref:CubicO group peptidase (Beta-lactamase class C family) n=1 Tax=Paenibacillus harenae TaxID=306543 RepID=A0ABT9U9Q3_PAEHA|nr:serine hydrolase domain-containing protein [Paenibacillus harenae]MDQ0116313.1 CubicO group peptidase (beta-lactamase class C family) [Paenibacillus harenae]
MSGYVLREGVAEQCGMSAERVVRAKRAASDMVLQGITPAQVVFAARNGTVIVHQADGWFDADTASEALTVNALFPLCSITKVFTAAAILILAEEGRIGLNRPVADYIPEFTGEGKQAVAVHHLLTHTSGIDPERLWEHKDRKRDSFELPPHPDNQQPSIHESLVLGYDVPLANRPGKIMAYCGYGYELLGEIIRRISGQSYASFVTDRIFHPLGMRNTFFHVPEEERLRIVRRPMNAPCAEWLETPSAIASESAGGGAYGTAHDLAVFAQMFLNGGSYNGVRLLSPITVKEMISNQIPGVSSQYRDETFPEAYWGYGWAINGTKRDGGDLFSGDAFSHWGAAGPFVCADPAYGTVTVHLSVELDHNRPFKNMYADYFNNTVLAAIEEL